MVEVEAAVVFGGFLTLGVEGILKVQGCRRCSHARLFERFWVVISTERPTTSNIFEVKAEGVTNHGSPLTMILQACL